MELCRRQTGKSNRLIVYLTSGIVMYQLLRLTTCSIVRMCLLLPSQTLTLPYSMDEEAKKTLNQHHPCTTYMPATFTSAR